MKLILFFIFTLLSTNAFATEERLLLVLGGWSYHTGNRDFNFNEVHEVFGVSYEDIGETRTDTFEILTFKNSIYKRSVFLNFGMKHYYRFGDLGFKAGLITGYEETSYKYDGEKSISLNKGMKEIAFVALPVYSFDTQFIQFEFSYIPKGIKNKSKYPHTFTLITKFGF